MRVHETREFENVKIQGEHYVLLFSVAEGRPRNSQGRRNALLGSLERVARHQPGGKGEIPITRVNAMRDANRCDAGVVGEPAHHVRTIHDPLQNSSEVVSLADNAVRRRPHPSHESAPSMIGRLTSVTLDVRQYAKRRNSGLGMSGRRAPRIEMVRLEEIAYCLLQAGIRRCDR